MKDRIKEYLGYLGDCYIIRKATGKQTASDRNNEISNKIETFINPFRSKKKNFLIEIKQAGCEVISLGATHLKMLEKENASNSTQLEDILDKMIDKHERLTSYLNNENKLPYNASAVIMQKLLTDEIVKPYQEFLTERLGFAKDSQFVTQLSAVSNYFDGKMNKKALINYN